ncbi:MAG: hypothetical protein ACKPA8_21140 [Dolichospermum sp.]
MVDNISWQNYQQILAALGDNRSSRLIYDQGTLEISMPSEEHESATRLTVGVPTPTISLTS